MQDCTYSDWQPHYGASCPVNPQLHVQLKMGNGDVVGPIPAGEADWYHERDPITHYRYPVFRAFKLLEEVADILRPVE